MNILRIAAIVLFLIATQPLTSLAADTAVTDQPSTSQASNYSIYLVRHAEKLTAAGNTKKDPPLTNCGRLRAHQLADTLSLANIDAVYSTSYKRTLQTATPTATTNKLAVKQYSPKGLAQLARLLKQNQQTALVVGHSNTTPELVKQLTGVDVGKIKESEYQYLYQVSFINNKASLTTFKQPLICR